MAGHLRLVKPEGPKPPRRYHRRTPVFSPEEEARLRAALRHARRLFGTWACLADAMRVRPQNVEDTANRRSRVSGDMAVRLARALGKPLDALIRPLTDASRCPTCGRGTP